MDWKQLRVVGEKEQIIIFLYLIFRLTCFTFKSFYSSMTLLLLFLLLEIFRQCLSFQTRLSCCSQEDE